MKINTKALVSAKNEFRLYKERVAVISDEINSAVSVISSLNGIDGVGVKLRRISTDLEETSMVLSRMSCLLEMASETYNKTEETVAEKSAYAGRNITVYAMDNPTITRFPRYADLLPENPTSKLYILKEPKISSFLVEFRKNYFTNFFVGTDKVIVKTYNMRFGSQAASIISTIGKF